MEWRNTVSQTHRSGRSSRHNSPLARERSRHTVSYLPCRGRSAKGNFLPYSWGWMGSVSLSCPSFCPSSLIRHGFFASEEEALPCCKVVAKPGCSCSLAHPLNHLLTLSCTCSQSEHYQDLQLKRYSTEANLIVISVGYRLAPEHPFPKGNEDCEDVAEYLIDHGQKEFGAELKFIVSCPPPPPPPPPPNLPTSKLAEILRYRSPC